MNYLIITKKIWNHKNYKIIKNNNFFVKKKINLSLIKRIKPRIIFFIHWSNIIPKNIYEKNLCIQFHSSDLPKFRGGSPIQNQILKGLKFTKISAFKVNSKIDKGNICMKSNLKLDGSAIEIYQSMEKTSLKMIKKLIKKKYLDFKPQKGKGSYFKRRIAKDSNIKSNKIRNLEDFYNFIRMLDADNYPRAFLKYKKFNIKFLNTKKNKKYLFGKYKIEY